MNAPRYHVYDPDCWSGSSYTTTDSEDAFAAWRCNTAQLVEMVEFVPGQSSGIVVSMNADFEEMLTDERRQALSVARHNAAIQSDARLS